MGALSSGIKSIGGREGWLWVRVLVGVTKPIVPVSTSLIKGNMSLFLFIVDG